MYVGQHNVNRPGPYTRTLRVSKLIQHPKYTHGVAPYDIALVKVASPISFDSAVVSPACLPKDDKNFEGMICQIWIHIKRVGWDISIIPFMAFLICES